MRVSVSSIFTSVQHGYKANLVRMRTEPCDSATRCEGCRLPASPVVERSAYLRQLLAEQGLLEGAPLAWPTNVSFLQLLHAVGVTQPGFAVDVGAGDGQRLDTYKRPINPVNPLFQAGYAGLSIEEDRQYDGQRESARRGMPYASARLSEVLAKSNSSGGIRLAWATALPSNIGALLSSAGTPGPPMGPYGGPMWARLVPPWGHQVDLVPTLARVPNWTYIWPK